MRWRRWSAPPFFGAVLFDGLFLLGIAHYAEFKSPLHVNRAVLRVLARMDEP